MRMDGYVNDEHYGGGSWDEIHWSFGEMPAHASRGTTLRAGDILASGPVGTGCIQELSGHRPYLDRETASASRSSTWARSSPASPNERTTTMAPDVTISRSITIAAPPSAVFAVIADPHRHAGFDGSGTVKKSVSGPERLSLGAKFRMSMKLFGVRYQITNTVKEYDENRRIAWAHPGRHRCATSSRRFRAGRGLSRPATSPPRRSAGCWRAPAGPR
ncbi:SRPBCC family protein [Streptomyces sp. 11-1-2]|uniref:SRPBCC family protein n=1 Tax=unclassified Streptomyces TaxID=2593676 RepID=UPI001968C953|nr:SRPBCC family protein [Streptomyces sp. 11-1-2]